MPKRVVDGEALWLSEKVKTLPEEYRMHYANWIPLAEANGVFEASVDRVYARVYSFLMPSISKKKVRGILDAFIRVGLIRVWSEGGKTWGYFVGIEKTGRLPSLKHLDRYTNLPPAPPSEDESGINPGQSGTEAG